MTVVAEPDRVELEIEGMTCAACASRIERRLNRLDSVEANVSYASEEAFVTFDPAVIEVADLLVEVEHTGYHAVVAGARGSLPEPEGTGRLVVAALLTVPLVVLAMVEPVRFDGWEWVALVLATPVVFWAGLPFHISALRGLRHGAVTMDTLVSLGTSVAYLWSLVILAFGLSGETYFEVAAVITTLILLGRWLETRAQRRSGEAIRALASLAAQEVVLLREGVEVCVPIEEVRVGDRFVVRPGERVATDGVVVEGRAAVDTSMLSGEPVPVETGPGDDVTGGTLDTDGVLVVEATRVGADTALARISRLVARAQAGKAPVQRLVDRVSAVFVPVVVALAAATFVGWLVAGGTGGEAVTAAVAVLIVACPCALGLATPTALVVGSGRGAQLGILIRGPEVLERTREVTTVVLDKTGTLTEGRLHVTDVVTAEGVDEDELIRFAGAAEHGSEHPIATAIVARARESSEQLPAATGFRSHAGAGVEAEVDGRRVVVTRASALDELELDGELASRAEKSAAAGGIVVGVGWDGLARGLVLLADEARPTARRAVEEFRALGLTPVLATGDSASAAATVAREVGISDVIAGTLPEDKAAVVTRLQGEGEVVAMVGDGVNDAPALACADLGLALGTGADIATEAADITLVSGDLLAAVDAIRLARRTLSTIHVNLFWAFAYNVAALPLAALGLLDPMLAGAAMACSSLFVVGNSLRLRRFGSVRAA